MTTISHPELEGLDRYKFGWADSDTAGASARRGLNEEVVRDISAKKNEPEWMLDLRLKGLKRFRRKPMPGWGADLSGIDFDNIKYFVRSTEKQAASWDDLPADIKSTYDKLGIPEAEKQRLVAGVAAQYESEVVYHKIREDLEEKGVIFADTDTALKERPELFREYFATVIPVGDNKFAALNTAVWSGGSFIYVPKGVHVEIPLQAYFRINTENMGQFERTLIIVDEGAYVHYVVPDHLQVGGPGRRPDLLPRPGPGTGRRQPLQVHRQVRRAAGGHRQPVRHLPVRGRARGQRGDGPRGQRLQDLRGPAVLPHEPRHDRGRGVGHHRARLRRADRARAADGVRTRAEPADRTPDGGGCRLMAALQGAARVRRPMCAGCTSTRRSNQCGCQPLCGGTRRPSGDRGRSARHCRRGRCLVYGVLHGLVLSVMAGGWDLGLAGATHASAGPPC